jgi:hypothetical protein
MQKNKLTSLNEFVDKHVGSKETKKRKKFDKGYKAFKLDALIQIERQARIGHEIDNRAD